MFSSTSELDQRDISVSKPEPLDVVYKAQNDPSCYVYTNESARRGLRDSKTRIEQQEFRVRIRVHGANFSELSHEFTVRHGPDLLEIKG
jgi:hypothetical protein